MEIERTKLPAQASSASLMRLSALLLVCTICMGAFAGQAAAMQMVEQSDSVRSPSATVAIVENPEITIRVLENLLRSIVYSAADLQPIASNGVQKRGLDLGISRGFSGSQAGKHLMGLSAASFANGPGKR